MQRQSEKIKQFDSEPIEEKKALLRQLVLGMTVNPVERVAYCSITKTPMVSPVLRSALLPSGFVSKTCSGDSPPQAENLQSAFGGLHPAMLPSIRHRWPCFVAYESMPFFTDNEINVE